MWNRLWWTMSILLSLLPVLSPSLYLKAFFIRPSLPFFVWWIKSSSSSSSLLFLLDFIHRPGQSWHASTSLFFFVVSLTHLQYQKHIQRGKKNIFFCLFCFVCCLLFLSCVWKKMLSIKQYFIAKLFFVCQSLPLRCLELNIFFYFQCYSTVNSFFFFKTASHSL